MSFFGKLIPSWVPLAVIAFLCALILGQRVQVSNAKANVARSQKELADYKLGQSEQRTLADRAQRTEEQRRTDVVTKEATNATTESNALAPDVRRASGAADGLRSAAANTARRACPSPAPATASPREPDTGALDLLVDVLSRSSGRNAELAEYADRLRIAGAACERITDALSKR